METFAEKVTKIFHDSGKLQTEFARCAGISEKTFRNYRDGATSPSLEAVAGIARYFNVNCNWLILDEGPIYRDQEKETPKTTNVKDTNVNFLGVQRVSKDNNTNEEAPETKRLQEQIRQLQATIASLTETNQKLVNKLLGL